MRALIRWSCLVIATVVVATPASAQVVQSVQVGVGGFFPAGINSRDNDDVLLRNYLGEALPGRPSVTDALAFEMRDFRSAHLTGEWNVTVGDRIELGIGTGFYRKTVPTVYYDLEDDRGRDISQELSLRIAPITGVVRFMPFGRAGQAQPYVGAGVSLLNFRYSEDGDFVDGDTLDVFSDRYTVSGRTVGTVLLGGIKLPLNGDIYGLNIEGRYQMGVGDTGGTNNQFLADKIDLRGFHLLATFQVRF
jgi:hypothetical protein